jgi:alcohol dehydrogenase class IV
MSENVHPAFTGRERPLLSHGIAFPAAAARHVTGTFGASRVYVICSGSLARNTDALNRLTAALGPEKVVGQRIGMQSHTLWSEVLEIVADARKVQADLLLTLGAGSLTDGAKIIALVGYFGLPFIFQLLNISTVRPLPTTSVRPPSSRRSPRALTNALISVRPSCP